MKKPSKAAIRADAKLQQATHVEIHRGQTLDGIDWILVVIGKFGEFRCGRMTYELISLEDCLIIKDTMIHVSFPHVQDAIENILYVE